MTTETTETTENRKNVKKNSEKKAPRAGRVIMATVKPYPLPEVDDDPSPPTEASGNLRKFLDLVEGENRGPALRMWRWLYALGARWNLQLFSYAGRPVADLGGSLEKLGHVVRPVAGLMPTAAVSVEGAGKVEVQSVPSWIEMFVEAEPDRETTPSARAPTPTAVYVTLTLGVSARTFILAGDQADADERMVELEKLVVASSRYRGYTNGQGRDIEDELREAAAEYGQEDPILEEGMLKKFDIDTLGFFDAAATYAAAGLAHRRGLLLCGPPGVGKTHLIRRLLGKIFALSEEKRPGVISVSSLGDSSNIQELFAVARRMAPVVMIVEDIDHAAGRGNMSAFLNEVDGTIQNNGVLIIGTTNNPRDLDPAILRRPSRFDRKYFFTTPAAALRQRFFTAASEKGQLQLDTRSIEQLAEATGRLSFAYLKEIIAGTRLARLHPDNVARTDASVALEIAAEMQKQIRDGGAELGFGKDD